MKRNSKYAYWERSFSKCLTSHSRILASLSLSICSLSAYPETCEQFLEKRFFLYTHQSGNFLMIPELEKAREFLLPLWNYKKKAWNIFFLFLIAFSSSQGKQKKLYIQNESC